MRRRGGADGGDGRRGRCRPRPRSARTSCPSEIVLNKVDLVDPLKRRRLANRFPGAPQVSAQTGEGLDELRAPWPARFAERFEAVRLLIPYDAGDKLAELYELGAPVDERIDRPEGVFVRARLSHADLRRFAPFLVLEEDEASQRHATVTELLFQRLRDDAVVPERGLRGRRGARSRRVRPGRRSAPGSGRSSAPGSRSRSPTGTPASSSRARAWQPSTGHRAEHARPDRLRLPRRGARDPAQHRTDRRRSSSSPGCGSPSSSSCPFADDRARSRSTSCRATERGVRGFGSSSRRRPDGRPSRGSGCRRS